MDRCLLGPMGLQVSANASRGAGFPGFLRGERMTPITRKQRPKRLDQHEVDAADDALMFLSPRDAVLTMWRFMMMRTFRSFHSAKDYGVS